jgi:peptidoglycan hydrolase-like protein with peptidoglycan-binding domain
MNPHTAEALRSFQRRQGLQVTGRPDPATMMALGLER